jgi:hypothetical protein
MAANTPMAISELSKAGVILYMQQCMQVQMTYMNMRARLEQMDRIYMREVDRTQKQRLNKALNAYGDASKFQNIVVPIAEPQVENAVVYQASVFLTGNPIFGVVADPQNQDAALQMQTVIEENSIRGGWTDQLLVFFRDLFKYNLGAIEITWESKTTAAVETDLTYKGGKEGRPQNVIWSGNVLKRLDLYNTFFDARVGPAEISEKGEFAGYIERISRIALIQFMNGIEGITQTVKDAALASPVGGGAIGFQYVDPQINPEPIVEDVTQSTGPNWMEWAGLTQPGTIRQPYSFRI